MHTLLSHPKARVKEQRSHHCHLVLCTSSHFAPHKLQSNSILRMVRRMRTGSETLKSGAAPQSGNSVHSVIQEKDTLVANRDNFDSDISEKKPRGVMRLACLNGTRLMVLMILCLQNSIFTVLRRYSQGILKEDYSKVRVRVDLSGCIHYEITFTFVRSMRSCW